MHATGRHIHVFTSTAGRTDGRAAGSSRGYPSVRCTLGKLKCAARVRMLLRGLPIGGKRTVLCRGPQTINSKDMCCERSVADPPSSTVSGTTTVIVRTHTQRAWATPDSAEQLKSPCHHVL